MYPRNRVLETTTSTGTGNITVSGAVTGFRAIGSVLSVGQDEDFAIWAVDANGNATGDFEIVRCTYSSANTLTRSATPYDSSNAGAAVNFSAGTKWVALTTAAENIFTGGRGLAFANGFALT